MIIETAYQYLFTGAMVLLILLIGIMLVRAVIGPRITDRILSINMIGTMVISCILVLAVWLKEDFLTDVAIIYAMISFLAVLMLAATYIPSHAARGAFGEDGQEKSTSREEVRGADGTGAENGVFRQVPEAPGEGGTENGSTVKNAAGTQAAGSAGKAGVSKNSSGAKGKSAGSTGTAGVPKSSSGAKGKSAGSAGKSAARKSDSDVKEKAAGSAGTARMQKSDSGAKGKSAARKNSSGAKGSAGRKSQGGRKK